MTSVNTARPAQWRSFHIFLWDAAKADRFLAQILLPRLTHENAPCRWFFIRYWEGGPHIRLRLKGEDCATLPLIEELKSLTRDYCSAGLLEPASFYRDNVFEHPIESAQAMPWFEEGSIQAIPYEPEITRYGGQRALPHQERLFELSSRLAAKIILATQHSWRLRADIAIQMMIGAALSISSAERDVSEFFQRYAQYWEAFARPDGALPFRVDHGAIARRICKPSARLLPRLWLDALEQANASLLKLHADGELVLPQTGQRTASAVEAREAVRAIVASQIHMLNNRLGIGPDREHAFACSLSMPTDRRVTNVRRPA